MAQQKINYGAAPNDGTGDLYRVAMIKIDNNFTDLYAIKVDKTVTIALSGGATGTATALSGSAVVIPVTDLNMGNATAGTLAVARGGTGVTTSTGTGANVQAVSPALTGTPTVPTAADTANSTQIASTAFVRASTVKNGMLDIFGSGVDRYVSSAGTAVAPYDDANTFPPGTRVLATRSFVANLPGTESLIYVETTANYTATAGRLQIGYGYQNGGCWMRWATSSNIYGSWQKFLMESGGNMEGQLGVLNQLATDNSVRAANTAFVHGAMDFYGVSAGTMEAQSEPRLTASGSPATNDLNLMVGGGGGGTYTLEGTYLNGPFGASASYTGVLSITRRKFNAGPAVIMTIYQLVGSTPTVWFRMWNGTTWTAWDKQAFETSNVASATRLATARTITVGNTSKTFDGTGDISFSGAETGVTGPNLLYNTDFLLGNNSTGIPNYWTCGGTASTGLASSLVPYLPFATSSLTRSAYRISCTSSTNGQYLDIQAQTANGSMPVTPGTAYTLSTKFRAIALAEYRTYIQFRNAAGTVISTINGAVLVATGDWQTHSTTGTAPADAVDAAVCIARVAKVAASPGAMWAEVVEPQFKEGATATPYQPGLNTGILGKAGGLRSGTDWNALLIDGDYQIWNILATSYTNAPPTTLWGMLRVRRNGSRIYQEYLTDTSPYISYVRRSGDSGATWTAWASPSSNLGASYGASQVDITNTAGTKATIAAASTTQAGVMVASDKVKLEGIEAGATKAWTATAIPSSANLNTYTTPGNFSCAANATASTLTNCPTTNAFSLNVYAAAGVVQVLTEYASNSTTSNKMWIRGIYSNIANTWQEVYTSGSPQLTTTTGAPGTNNTNIASTAFVQAAVSGVLSKAITGGAVTLTAAEASNAVIAFSGTLTSNATITFPTTVQRVWVVSNVTSGAFTLTVKSGTGNTVVVTQGRRDIVFSDGVDMNQADTDIVPVANGGTGVTTSTGTGSVVLSASPALTGNPTATTQAAADSSTRLATTAFVKSVTDPQATAISGKLGANWASIAGFIANGDEMYMQRSSDSKLFTIASLTGSGNQNFQGPVSAPEITSYGVGGFVKSGRYDAGGGLLAARVLSVPSLDAQTIFALLNPGVESSWRFDTGAANFYMKNSGVGYSAGGWAATSDNRVKYNVRPIESALDKICQLTGYTYIRQDMLDMQGYMPIRSGVIAQEVLKVLPSTVNVPANYDAEKNQGDLLSVSMDGLVGLLINAVKELRAEVEALKAGAV